MHFAGPAEHLQPLFHPYEIYARGTGYEMQFREKICQFLLPGDGRARALGHVPNPQKSRVVSSRPRIAG